MGNGNENKSIESISGAASLLAKVLSAKEHKKWAIQIKRKLIAARQKIDLNQTSFSPQNVAN